MSKAKPLSIDELGEFQIIFLGIFLNFRVITTKMEERFNQLWSRLGAKSVPESEYTKLVYMYSEPQRFYHNMTHVQNCLVELDSARGIVQQPNLVELAIWYHDAVYDTKSKFNEERSAQLAYDACLLAQLPEKLAKGVRDLILATKHDTLPEGIDARVLVDVDLSILGKSPDEFKAYEQNIRKEYFWVSEDAFKKGRNAMLQTFLRRAKNHSLYLTDYFRSRYETKAVHNIIYSIEKTDRSVKSMETMPRLTEREMRELPEAGIGLFSHWVEDDSQKKNPEAGIGLLNHWTEHEKKEDLPDAGIGLFRHWIEDD